MAGIKMQFRWNAVAPGDIKVAQTIHASLADAANVVEDAPWAPFTHSRVSAHVGRAQS